MENSSTMTSEHAIYTKVPPAREEKIMSVSSDDPDTPIPIEIPRGVAKAKIPKSRYMVQISSLKFLLMLIPRDIAAAHLCKLIAIT